MLSCSKSTLENRITFTATCDVITRGTPVVQASDISDMGVFAYYTGDGATNMWSVVGSSSSPNLMSNIKVFKSGDIWVSQISKYWPVAQNGNVSFFSYTPYASASNGLSLNVSTGLPTITYSVPTVCTNQPDLMVSVPVLDKNISTNATLPISFHMKHALACVGFTIKGNSESISKIALKGVSVSGDLSVDGAGTIFWNNLSSPTTTEYSANIPASLEADPGGIDATTADGYLMMIPQTLVAGAKLVVVVDGKEREVNLSGEWLAGVKYMYNITVKEEINYSKQPNCYIMNPSTTSATTLYVPLGKANYYWESYASPAVTANTIPLDTEEWAIESTYSVVKLWSDFGSDGKTNPAITLTKVNGSSDAEPSVHSIKVTIPANCPEGNMLISVKKETTILWSWHIWITNYKPDDIAAANTPANNIFKYTKSGLVGELHRYKDGTFLTTGNILQWGSTLSNKFIMDRSLGARPDVTTPVSTSDSGPGVLYYQFGRKDPFPGSWSTWIISTDTKGGGPVTMSTSINNPAKFYTNSSGNLFTDLSDLSYVWNDKRTNISTNNKKSIFDPCPKGWRVPRTGINSDFKFSSTVVWTSGPKRGVYRSIANFYTTGGRDAATCALGGLTANHYSWYSEPTSNTTANVLSIDLYNITVSNGIKTRAVPVRCVQE